MTTENSEPWNCIDLKVNIDDIAVSGKDISLKLDNETNAVLVKSLDLLELDMRRCDFSISNLPAECFRVETKLNCIVKQQCSVTLEPVETRIEQMFATEFWPTQKLTTYYQKEKEQDQDIDFESKSDFEEIEEGYINLGRYIYEVLSTTIDPYPKKEGAVFDWKNKNNDESDLSNNPFASLKVLKNGADE